MPANDLVQLSDAQNWLKLTGTNAERDVLLGRLITQISLAVYNYTGRLFFLPRTQTDVYNGNGRDWMQLRNWPVNVVSSVVVNGVTIPQSTAWNVAGWVLEAPDLDPPGNMQRLWIRSGSYNVTGWGSGYFFHKGVQNVSVTYNAGYQVLAEPQTVPAGSPYTVSVNGAYGPWGSDLGVTYANGTVMTAVASPVSAGQYSVSAGTYTFSAADASASVLISYGYVPADLSQAVLMWISQIWSQMDRVGVSTKSVGGNETVSYLNETIPKFVALALNNFVRVIPI